MKTRFVTLATTAALPFAVALWAQTPRGSAVTTVAGKKVAVDYGRPALKGRDLATLMKDLPADRIWRAGENQVTTFTTETPLSVAGKAVPAGKYSLYVHAGEKGGWTLILNRDLGVPLGKIWDKAPENMKNEPWPYLEGYTTTIGDKEVLRAEMKPAAAKAPSDLFTISFAPKGKGADMTLAWGKEAWSVDVQP
ncbi:MAG TPA: DUF2911 domain-containing protein [Vicinamibacteria bacterium]|nr:DUF2911 domain-containing protein [Vicinamibacteria bacterium]